ncbi:MAG: hypothetical protein NTZ52_02640 [Chlamydiae bacterium]|nr:hypothetical protein [Chlamydiota bacterium]
MKQIKHKSKRDEEFLSKSHGKLPRMRPYHPRKRVQAKPASQHLLSTFEHRLSADLGRFLVLLEEGSAEQITQASQKARSDFLKLKEEMHKLATDLGGNFPIYVTHFLESIDRILHTGSGWIDQDKIAACYKATQELEIALKRINAKD